MIIQYDQLPRVHCQQYRTYKKLDIDQVHFLNTIGYPEYIVNNTGLNEKYKKLDIDQVHDRLPLPKYIVVDQHQKPNQTTVLTNLLKH